MIDSKFSFMPPSCPLCTTLTTTLPFVFSLTLVAKSVIARTRMISGLFGDASAASIFCAAASGAVRTEQRGHHREPQDRHPAEALSPHRALP